MTTIYGHTYNQKKLTSFNKVYNIPLRSIRIPGYLYSCRIIFYAIVLGLTKTIRELVVNLKRYAQFTILGVTSNEI
jgi:hypothetical protein